MVAVTTITLLVVLVVLFTLRALLLGTARTVASVILHFFDQRPIRIDLPIPFFPVDVVLIKDPDQIRYITSVADRLDGVAFKHLQPWARTFFSTTRFHSGLDNSWFVPFVTDVKAARRRRHVIENALADKRHTLHDIQKVRKALYWKRA